MMLAQTDIQTRTHIAQPLIVVKTRMQLKKAYMYRTHTFISCMHMTDTEMPHLKRKEQKKAAVRDDQDQNAHKRPNKLNSRHLFYRESLPFRKIEWL